MPTRDYFVTAKRRPLTKVFCRTPRMRLDVPLPAIDTKVKAEANIRAAGWSLASYFRAITWLASEGTILVTAPKSKRRPAKAKPKKRRKIKKAPAVVSVMDLD